MFIAFAGIGRLKIGKWSTSYRQFIKDKKYCIPFGAKNVRIKFIMENIIRPILLTLVVSL